MYKYFVILIGIFIFAVPGAGFAQEPVGELLDVDALVRDAVAHNPSLESARLEYRAASLMVRPAGALPDPMVELGFMSLPVNTFSFTQEDMTQKVIGITQAFPYPGKLRLAGAVARSDAEAAKWQIAIYEQRLAFEVRKTCMQWAFADDAINITQNTMDVISQFTKVATSRYSVGAGNQWDILGAQVEQSKLSGRLATLKQGIESMKAMMASLLGRDSAGFSGAPAVKWTPVAKLDEAELIRRGDENNPTIAYLKIRAQRADNAAKLARRERYPNFSVNLAYGQRDNGAMNGGTVRRPDFLSATVGIELPLYAGRKQIPMAESAENMSASAKKMLADKTLAIHAEIRDKVAAIRRADEVEELYRTGILPQARTAVQSALASYRVSKADFLTLLTSQQNLLTQELDYCEVRINREIDIAYLALLVGEPVSQGQQQ